MAGVAGLDSGLHRAVRVIVQEALSRGVGASMPTNVDYAERHGISAGTMQRALSVLADRGALTVDSRGQLGRFIRSLDVAQCWQAAGLDPVRMLMPPSGPPEADVLVEQLAEGLTASGIPHTVHHAPGGPVRLAAVSAGVEDLTVVSAGAWSSYHGGGRTPHPPVLLRRLGPGTYYAPGRLVVVRRAGDDRTRGLRVAIDPDSPDHFALTMAALPPEAGNVHVPTAFPDVPGAVLRGTVDAGVWHIARSIVPLDHAGLRLDPLPPGSATELATRLSPAVLAGAATRPELGLAIGGLKLDGLVAAQAQALTAG